MKVFFLKFYDGGNADNRIIRQFGGNREAKFTG